MPKDISKLQKHEIEAYINEPFRKNGDLLKGYKIALDPTSWEEEVQAGIDERAEAEAEAERDPPAISVMYWAPDLEWMCSLWAPLHRLPGVREGRERCEASPA